MLRTVYANTCPQCGSKPAVLTINKRDGSSERAVCCMKEGCKVSTGFSDDPLEIVLWRWNNGVSLERFGKRYGYSPNKTREALTMRVDA